jgi:hypothetical protein
VEPVELMYRQELRSEPVDGCVEGDVVEADLNPGNAGQFRPEQLEPDPDPVDDRGRICFLSIPGLGLRPVRVGQADPDLSSSVPGDNQVSPDGRVDRREEPDREPENVDLGGRGADQVSPDLVWD